MMEISHSCRAFLHKNGQVMIRVRWNNRKCEVGFSVGCNADPEKWDNENQRARYNTTHKVGGKVYVARDINNRISQFLECIEESFTEYGVHSQIPTTKELKELVNEKLGRIEKEIVVDGPIEREKSFREIFNDFLEVCSIERSWSESVHHKYVQVWNQLNSCDPDISLVILDENKMTELKKCYVKNGYRNRTTVKQFRILKSFLRWIAANGYLVEQGVLNYKVNLTVTKKEVTFLKYKELLHFASFQFPKNKEYLDRARDMFCFMAFTSLRYSDLRALKSVHILNGKIEMYTQKTNDKITIPIIENAQKIIDKYSWYHSENGTIFPVPSNQKLNDYLKEAAELSGLDREIVETYFIGTQRHEEIHKFYETISCHDGRRTFVCCSLALGISPTVVMSCTGHSDYESMKPYIEVADETQKMQMEKWNTHQYKSGIIESLEKMTPAQLKEIYEHIRSIA